MCMGSSVNCEYLGAWIAALSATAHMQDWDSLLPAASLAEGRASVNSNRRGIPGMPLPGNSCDTSVNGNLPVRGTAFHLWSLLEYHAGSTPAGKLC